MKESRAAGIEKEWSELEELKAKLKEAEGVIKLADEVTESSREECCRYDHHRDCQEHGWFGLEGGDCPVHQLDIALKSYMNKYRSNDE